jgi:hypothetical protein
MMFAPTRSQAQALERKGKAPAEVEEGTCQPFANTSSRVKTLTECTNSYHFTRLLTRLLVHNTTSTHSV